MFTGICGSYLRSGEGELLSDISVPVAAIVGSTSTQTYGLSFERKLGFG